MTTPSETKDGLRRRLAAARRAVPPDVRAAEAAALGAWAPAVLAVARTTEQVSPNRLTVCAYRSQASEPGTAALLDALRTAGATVLLPIVDGPRASRLDWAEYTGADALAPGALGIEEPVGERLGPDALHRAEVVLVPALAVDRAGTRLGRGGGYYDRTLADARPATVLIGVVRDDELLDALPREPHDVTLGAALRPSTGITVRDG